MYNIQRNSKKTTIELRPVRRRTDAGVYLRTVVLSQGYVVLVQQLGKQPTASS